MSRRECGIEQYVSWRPDRDCWWFRRRVPDDVLAIIGLKEWRRTLKSRREVEARREAVPYLRETNQTIDLARAGNWPPIPDDEIAAVAAVWWRDFLAGRLATLRREGWVADRPLDLLTIDPAKWALPDDLEVLRSALCLIPETERADGFLHNKDALARLLRDCRIHHGAVAMVASDLQERDRACEAVQLGKIDPRQILRLIEAPAPPLLTARKAATPVGVPLPFNAVAGDNDLIAEWADWQTRRPKTVYEFRRIMKKLTTFVGYDDARRLTKAEVEGWVKSLKANGAAEKTIEGHLMALKTLLNFAVEHDLIEGKSPADGISYRARVNPRNKVRGYTNAEARVVLTAARQQERDFTRWSPWLCCFTGARLDEIAAAVARDVRRLGRYWAIDILEDNRDEDASIKNEASYRTVPLHQALIDEGFLIYWRGLPENGPLFPSLKADTFGSKAGNATKRIGPLVRALAVEISTLADVRLSPSHSWRHRFINECRRIGMRTDIEHAITGHAQEGTAPDYGEYAINELLGPAMDKTRSPFDVEDEPDAPALPPTD
jgi:integrase